MESKKWLGLWSQTRLTDYNSLVIDLCSGLGGASAAFDQDNVIKIDIERQFKPTIQADVQNLPLRSDLKPNLAIFAPPCDCFSIASVYRHWTKDGKPKPETKDAIQLVKKGIEEIHRINPRYWIMENPRGMLRKVIGKPPHTIRASDYGASWKKPTDLWGNVPFPMLQATRTWQKARRGYNGCTMPVRNPAKRAVWPYGLSEAVRDACNHTNSTRSEK